MHHDPESGQSVLRKDGQIYVVDNSVGATGLVVTWFDWWYRRQLNPSPLSRGPGCVDYSIDNRSTGGDIASNLCPDGAKLTKGKLCVTKTR